VIDLETLHEKASGHYLQGDLAAALTTWRQLLEAAPGDERAVEGVRLCEQAMGAEQQDVTVAGQSPFAVGTGSPEPNTLGDMNLDEELSELDMALDFGTKPVTDEAEDLPDLAPSDGEPEAAAKPAGVANWQWQSPGGEEDVESSAALRLRRRANELLASALVAMESSRHDEALNILERILILDEDNEAARSLIEKMRQDGVITDADPAPRDADDPSAIDWGTEEAVPLDLATPQLDDLELEEPLTDLEAPIEDLDVPLDADDPDPGPEQDSPETDASAVAAGPEPGSRFSRKSMIIAAVAGVVLLGGGGFWAFRTFFGSGGAEQAPPSVPVTVETAAAAVEAALGPVGTPAGLPGGSTDPAQGEDSAEQTLATRHADLIASGDEAFAAGEFGTAVRIYNEALRLEPDRAETEAKLSDAGERYRAQAEIDAKWDEAIAEYRSGNYRAALTLFYRLPVRGDADEVDRFKANGWYNLGVGALKAGRCDAALSHLEDAGSFRGGDEAILAGLALARSCDTGSKEYRRKIDALRTRALSD